MPEQEHWTVLARSSPLAVLTDLDGTLIPFAPTPEQARVDDEVVALLNGLAAQDGMRLALVSGRSRERLGELVERCPRVLFAAEHGAWWRPEGSWQAMVEDRDPEEIDDLYDELRRLAGRHEGARLERKFWAVALHVRAVAPGEKDEVLVEAEDRVAAWLERHRHFERLDGAEVLEVRPSSVNKGHAVGWTRALVGAGARVIALGDDMTDEDTFAALRAGDEGVRVGAQDRATAARWQLPAPAAAVAFLRWLLALRRGDAVPVMLPARIDARAGVEAGAHLLVVSNRLPELRSTADTADPRKRNVGGLVSALEPALRARGGIWLGWSGRTLPRTDTSTFGVDTSGEVKLAWVDFPEEWHKSYYNGFCNSALWPVLHSFATRVTLREEDWAAYQQANEAFASSAAQLVEPDAAVWIHDYHLFLLGRQLRARGHRGRIGLFLHVPFPGPDLWNILPWADELLEALLSLDLLAFHTPSYVANFMQCVATLPGVRITGDTVERAGRRTRIAAFPIGILPESFQEPPEPAEAEEARNLMRALAPTRLILGVDRLDYTKGIPERLEAFARLLELFPEWRRKVSLVQISVPSRGDVPEYAEQRRRIELFVGRANGELGDADWIPIRYLYRSFTRRQLSLLYRNAAVGYVTPLRDGMNLVAKEYVAAQDRAAPGVLVLSRFAGAAAELTDALLTNPWHIDGMARDLDRALRMDLDERLRRHRGLLEVVSRSTALTWAEEFLAALTR